MLNDLSVLCFDYGTKSIGVAIGQSITGTAKALSAIKAKNGIPNWNDIERLLTNWQPDLLLVGLPLDMHGEELDGITARTRKFANRLKGRFNINVELHDERLSTKEARSFLFTKGGYSALNKGNVDSQSAVLILESWFENKLFSL